MSLKIEKQEKNIAVLIIERPAEEVEKACTEAYNKIKNQVMLPGFRKGKVPQKMVERQYGADIFNEDAAEIIVNRTYKEEIKDLDLEIVSNPQIEIVEIERGKAFVYKATVATKPVVTLGTYKGVEYHMEKIEVTDEEVQRELERVQEMNSRLIPIEDRPAKKGDFVTIDFEGFINGKTFQGGKAEGHTLTLGNHSFIDTFEEQIEGHNVGDAFDVNVTFPEDYHSTDLAGKPAVFKVKLNEIKEKELPALDDEFAAEVSEFETLSEYKDSIKANMKQEREGGLRKAAEEEIIEKIVHTSDLDLPRPMVDDKIEDIYKDYTARLENQGISIQQYLQMVNQKPEDVKKEIEPMAIKDLKSRLVLEAIAKAENIEVSDEDVEKEIAQLAEAYQISPEDFKKIIPEEGMAGFKDDIAVTKAVDLIFEAGVAVEGKAEEAPAEEAPKPAKKKAAPKKAEKPAEEAPAEEAPKPAKKKAAPKKTEEPAEEAPAEEAPKPAKKKAAPKKKAEKPAEEAKEEKAE